MGLQQTEGKSHPTATRSSQRHKVCMGDRMAPGTDPSSHPPSVCAGIPAALRQESFKSSMFGGLWPQPAPVWLYHSPVSKLPESLTPQEKNQPLSALHKALQTLRPQPTHKPLPLPGRLLCVLQSTSSEDPPPACASPTPHVTVVSTDFSSAATTGCPWPAYSTCPGLGKVDLISLEAPGVRSPARWRALAFSLISPDLICSRRDNCDPHVGASLHTGSWNPVPGRQCQAEPQWKSRKPQKILYEKGQGTGPGTWSTHTRPHRAMESHLNTGPRSKSSLCIKGNGEPRKVCEPRRVRSVGKTSLLCPRFPLIHTLRDYTERSQCRVSVSSFCHVILSLAAPSHQAQSHSFLLLLLCLGSCQGAKGWSVSQAGSWKWNCWLIGLFLS